VLAWSESELCSAAEYHYLLSVKTNNVHVTRAYSVGELVGSSKRVGELVGDELKGDVVLGVAALGTGVLHCTSLAMNRLAGSRATAN
jgi:hypothetical protein